MNKKGVCEKILAWWVWVFLLVFFCADPKLLLFGDL